jgi:PHD/YefM family antitoxin component YafN of YafNO toxin-antitoxin module
VNHYRQAKKRKNAYIENRQSRQKMNIQYIIDEKGRQKAVIIPIKEWEAMLKENERMKNKLAVLNGIKDALDEVQEIKEGKRQKGKRLTEFLNEV